jgi:DNA-directed RNA polymerase beta subunit
MISFHEILEATGSVFNKQSDAGHSGDDASVDIDTILASTEKLLAVNRGVAEPDERDSLEFRRVHSPDKLFSERVELDADRLRSKLMRRLARQKTLRAMPVSYFDPYVEGLVVGHPLSSPLEEINPLQLVEQARRITQFGPGGITSESQVTSDAQALHPSVFGFLSTVEGPESERIGLDTRLAWGTKLGTDGQIYQEFLNRRTGKRQWVSPSGLMDKVIGLPD